jgi:LysR family glycine cleavage system transcriptional activator
VPRLPRFHHAHPEIELRVLADEHPVKLLDGHGAEVAVRFGLGAYPGLAVTPIVADSIGPVCTPLLLARHGIIETVDALLGMKLLSDSAAERDDSGSGWASWLAHVGAPADAARLANGPRMSQAHLVIEAALLGHGVALAAPAWSATTSPPGAWCASCRRPRRPRSGTSSYAGRRSAIARRSPAFATG